MKIGLKINANIDTEKGNENVAFEAKRGFKMKPKGATEISQSRPKGRPREDRVTNFWRSELVGRGIFAHKDSKSMEWELLHVIYHAQGPRPGEIYYILYIIYYILYIIYIVYYILYIISYIYYILYVIYYILDMI